MKRGTKHHDTTITVLIPTHDNVPAQFMYDAMQLCSYTVAKMPQDTNFGTCMVTGTYIHSARQELMEYALGGESDYVLWLDSDMAFPKESLIWLLQHKLPMVGINYVKREVPTSFVALKKVPGERLITSPDSEGLEEVEAVGFGMVLMRTADFMDLPRGEPWFQQKWLPDLGQWMGEDTYFCEMVRRELGIRIMVDHDLSHLCAHIGQFQYRPYLK